MEGRSRALGVGWMWLGMVALSAGCTGDDDGPTCGPADCPGCCLDGVCVSGASDDYCGLGGIPCFACEPGVACESGYCVGVTTCGNGFIDPREECDDGNRSAGDGCDSICRREGAADAGMDVRPDADVGRRCVGTAVTCSSLTTSSSCLGQLGCSLLGESCEGYADPCSFFSSSSSCSGQTGCRWDGECSGSARSCYSIFSSFACIDQDGCYWSSYSETCSGSARSCSSMYGSYSCIDQDGCHWVDECTGTPWGCILMDSAYSCLDQDGCRWNDGTCSGSARPCTSLLPDECLDQAGCRLE